MYAVRNVLLAALVAAGGCTPGFEAARQSVRQVIAPPAPAEPAALDPKFAYLRVTRGRHVGLLWRGSMETARGRPVEVYYSSTGEVIRLLDGRLVGALGLATEWRAAAWTAPDWDAAVKAPGPLAVTRVRDVMPGYRTGVRDELVLSRAAPPTGSALRGLDPSSLTWFEERVQAGGFRLPGTPDETLPRGLYAVNVAEGKATVVYSEQCLAADLCFTWQRWSAAMQQALAPPRAP